MKINLKETPYLHPFLLKNLTVVADLIVSMLLVLDFDRLLK